MTSHLKFSDRGLGRNRICEIFELSRTSKKDVRDLLCRPLLTDLYLLRKTSHIKILSSRISPCITTLQSTTPLPMPKNCPTTLLYISILFGQIPGELGKIRTIFQTHPQSAHVKGLGGMCENIDRKLPIYDISLAAFTQLAFAITFQPLIPNQSQMTTSSISKRITQ